MSRSMLSISAIIGGVLAAHEILKEPGYWNTRGMFELRELCIILSDHQCRYQFANYKNRTKLLQYIFDN